MLETMVTVVWSGRFCEARPHHICSTKLLVIHFEINSSCCLLNARNDHAYVAESIGIVLNGCSSMILGFASILNGIGTMCKL